jgi:predicted phage terminase large subunit-like protein
MTPEQIADCQSDMLTFARTMFRARKGVEMKPNWHQDAICNALERVLMGKCTRLIINISPRSGKTELAVVSFISWATGLYPDSEWIHASYSKRLATNNAYGVREVMRHEVYQQIFPWVKIRDDSSAKDEFRTEQGGVVYATGSEGSITGRGAGGMSGRFQGAIVIDDPHKPGEANSDVMRQNVIDWFSTTMESRKNRPDTPIIVIKQRLHESDLSGWLLAGGNGEKWEHLNIPAETEDGLSFWPEQFPWEDLKRKEASNRYVYAGQYMQNPAPVGGGIFKDEWWQYYDAAPTFKWRAIYADTAMKTKEQNDYSVFQCWGVADNGKAYLLGMIRGKWEAPELLAQARAFWNKHKAGDSTLRYMKVEDKASGTGLIQTLKREGVPVLPVQRNIDKVTRAMDTAPSIEAGHVYLPRNAPFISDLLTEATQFPNAAHDDTLDPLMDAVSDMLIMNKRSYSLKNL